MAQPEPTEVAPWYLRNITQALALDETTGNVYVRTDANISVGNITVGNVGITSLGNVDISGNALPVTMDGNVTVLQGTDPWNVTGNVTIANTANVSLGAGSIDAFGRLRVSNPVTLFDTQNRYYDHELFASSTTGSGAYNYNSNSSTFSMSVSGTSGDSVFAETYKVFPYQPGKSLLIYATFCMSNPKANLRQRAGYFSEQNGIFFETNGLTKNMVIRSYSSGVVVEDRISQNNWNGDKLDGTGPSGLTLDVSLDQIYFCDIEWLGVGSVRTGFVINGQYIICHTFNHANQPGNTTTYMSTASLPLRYEIQNTGATSGSSSLTQICSSVISEGGYSLSGIPRGIGHNLGTPIRLPNDSTFKPIISIRLKSSTPDSIVLPKFYTIAPVAQSVFKFRVYTRAITTGGVWTDVGSDSPVQYNLSPATLSSGDIVSEGFIISSNQSSAAPSQVGFGFENQLQRNSFTATMYEYVITAATTGTNQDVYSSVDWQEVN